MPWADDASTVPTTRPVDPSTSEKGRPPPERMSVRAWAGSAWVQYHPCGRRRRRPAAVELVDDRGCRGPEQCEVVLTQRQLLGRGAQVRSEHVGVGGVEDGLLDRLVEQGLRVGDQIGVERVVTGDQHSEGVAGVASCPAHLLPPGRAGAREAGDEHRIEPRHVDPQLEGVGRGQPEQPAVAQRLLDLATFLGEVAAAIPGHPAGSEGSTSASRRAVVAATCSAARRERTKASVRTPSLTRSVSRSAASDAAARRTGAPFSPTYDVKRGSHRARAVSPRGESSWLTAATSRPVRRDACSAGLPTVAEASTKVGSEPCAAQTRRRRRSTCATWAPKTPR